MKRALVLSGGGAKGAWQVGALRYLMLCEGRRYDIITGVSVGALNGSGLAMFPKGEEAAAYHFLEDLWDGVCNDRIRVDWPVFGKLASLWKPSVYDSRPLQNLVREKLDIGALRASGKELRVGCVDLDTGSYALFGQNHDAIVEAVIASSAYPVFLLPVSIGQSLWTDGGVRTVTPLKAAIDLGADHVDVLLTSRKGASAWNMTRPPTALDVALRAIDLMGTEVIENDLQVCATWNKLVLAGALFGKRSINLRVLRPSVGLTDDSLDFTPSELERMRDIGYADALALFGGRGMGARKEE